MTFDISYENEVPLIWLLICPEGRTIYWQNSLVVACLLVAWEVSGSNCTADKSFCFSQKSLRCAALGMGCILTGSYCGA